MRAQFLLCQSVNDDRLIASAMSHVNMGPIEANSTGDANLSKHSYQLEKLTSPML